MEEFNPDLCKERHDSMNQRMAKLERSWEDNLQRIYDKIEEAMKRLPVWVTVVISLLSATCTGLIVAIVKSH